ncbi:MAG: CHAD domain-containing protein [Acidobacteriaceae bacterium]
MRGEILNIRRLAAGLRENLVKCAADPDVDPVHDTRTGTRRLQATLENLVRETPEGETGAAVRGAAEALMRQLKKIRRAAGTVRDLDVHRKLLEKLAACELKPEAQHDTENKDESSAQLQPDLLESPEAGLRTSGLARHTGELDAWLKHHRGAQADRLRVQAPELVTKFNKRLAQLEDALREHPQRRRVKPPAKLALDSFARLATEMQLLDGANLHNFRKGAKKARYVAELAAQTDTHAGAVGKSLKKLQDEIGDWHDWLVLAEEAHAALGDDAADLTALVEGKRDRHFDAAMKTAAKLRGRLMGEWLAGSQPKKRSAVKRPAQSRPAKMPPHPAP